MTKYIGSMIAWVSIAGIVLYLVQHVGDLTVGFSAMQQLMGKPTHWITHV